jgi:two-component system invasion response regulator UvrY
MRVLICDDHKIVRDGLKQIILQIDRILLIEEANDGSEAIEKIRNTKFDIVLLDITLPDKNGLEVLKSIKEKSPASKVLMLSMHHQNEYVRKALQLGASGYLTKDAASEELIHAIRIVSEGKKYLSKSLAEDFVLNILEGQHSDKPLHDSLSEREFEIMQRIAKGLSLIEIGNELFISVKTVSTYRTRIMEKMGMTKNAELTIYCYKNNLI